jgi:NAD(P)-dependent dehydrogenase (short-subunit alcohol dehydrogenase family)
VLYRSSSQSAAQVISDIESAGGRAAIRADLGDEEEVVPAFETVDQNFGRLGTWSTTRFRGDPTRPAELQMNQVEGALRTNLADGLLCAPEAVTADRTG